MRSPNDSIKQKKKSWGYEGVRVSLFRKYAYHNQYWVNNYGGAGSFQLSPKTEGFPFPWETLTI